MADTTDTTRPPLTGREALLAEVLGEAGRLLDKQENATEHMANTAARLEAAGDRLVDILQRMTSQADKIAARVITQATSSTGTNDGAGIDKAELAALLRNEFAGKTMTELRKSIGDSFKQLRSDQASTLSSVLMWICLAGVIGGALGGLVTALVLNAMT